MGGDGGGTAKAPQLNHAVDATATSSKLRRRESINKLKTQAKEVWIPKAKEVASQKKAVAKVIAKKKGNSMAMWLFSDPAETPKNVPALSPEEKQASYQAPLGDIWEKLDKIEESP